MSMLTMGLNQDTLDTLHQTDGITKPNEMNAGSGTTIVVDTDTESTDKLGQEVIDNFDDYEIILTTHKDLDSDRVRLEDVAQAVMAAESISYSDIQGLLKSVDVSTASETSERIVVAGIAARLDEKVPLDSYTENPSTVNLADTQKFFKKELNLNREAFAKVYSDFFMNQADVFITRANVLIESLAKEIEFQEAWQQKCMDYLKVSNASKSYLAYLVIEQGEIGKRYRESKLYDIRHLGMGAYLHSDVIEYGYGVPSSLFTALGQFFNREQGKTFIRTVEKTLNGDLSNTTPYYRTILELLRRGGDEGDCFGASYNELLAFFTKGDLLAKLTEMKTYLEHEIIRVSTFREACKNNAPCFCDDKEWGFHEVVSHVALIIVTSAETVQFLTMAETSRNLSAPVFEVMNAVLSA